MDTLPESWRTPVKIFEYLIGRARNSHTEPKIIIIIIELNIFEQVY